MGKLKTRVLSSSLHQKEQKQKFANKRDEIVKSRTRIEKELSDLLQDQGGYQKHTIRPEVFLPLVEMALNLAKKHQLTGDNWVTDAFYTRVAVLVSRILRI